MREDSALGSNRCRAPGLLVHAELKGQLSPVFRSQPLPALTEGPLFLCLSPKPTDFHRKLSFQTTPLSHGPLHCPLSSGDVTCCYNHISDAAGRALEVCSTTRRTYVLGRKSEDSQGDTQRLPTHSDPRPQEKGGPQTWGAGGLALAPLDVPERGPETGRWTCRHVPCLFLLG